MLYQFFVRVFLAIVLILLSSFNAFSIEDKDDFSQYYDFVYQIRVVAEKAGSKSSSGSAFQISESGLIITNYHVISSYIQYPNKNKITYKSHSGETGTFELIEFDVINDIALLQHPKPEKQFFKLSEVPLKKGDTIFSLGNPGDYGVKLVKGPNNGIADHRYDEQILFSASLNGGMSGGPALNKLGEVVGVNVATAGGQLSFLVPVNKVLALIEKVTKVEENSFQDELARQIKQWQRPRIGELLDSDWPIEKFVDRSLFGQIRSDFTCWGSTNEDDNERRIHKVRKRCRTGHVIYLDGELNTGNVVVFFQELESLKLNAMQFSEVFDLSMSGSSKSNFDNVSNYQCHSDFIELENNSDEYALLNKCVRHYKKLKGLFDSLMRVDVIKNTKAFTAFISMYGVEKDQIQKLNRKFIEKVL